ncbi:hypothetical protein ACHAWO_008631 [Cyclotella atomus]|uniref:Uncharacterized protein n=1 Tax=Cyclotella atomus TaxID=382360 RepID=A0ABD3N1S9_9STRA
MGPGTVGYKRLKALIMEPRCWKFLMEHFPGAEALRDPSQPLSSYRQSQQAPREQNDIPYEQYILQPRAPDAVGVAEVSDCPIMSPQGIRGGAPPVTRQG